MNIDLYSLDFFFNFALMKNLDRILFGNIFEIHSKDTYFIYSIIYLKKNHFFHR